MCQGSNHTSWNDLEMHHQLSDLSQVTTLFVHALIRMLRTLQFCTLETVISFPFHGNTVSSYGPSYWLSAHTINLIPKFRTNLDSSIYTEYICKGILI